MGAGGAVQHLFQARYLLLHLAERWRGVNESEHTWRAQIRRDAATRNEIAFEKLVAEMQPIINQPGASRPAGFAPGFVSCA